MDEIMTSLIRIAALLLLLLGSYVAKRLDSWLKASLNEKEEAALDQLVDTLTEAAEQLFHAVDEDGSLRLDYVQGMLIEAGYDITEAVRAKIESRVFKINKIQQIGS